MTSPDQCLAQSSLVIVKAREGLGVQVAGVVMENLVGHTGGQGPSDRLQTQQFYH